MSTCGAFFKLWSFQEHWETKTSQVFRIMRISKSFSGGFSKKIGKGVAIRGNGT
jgi:hypothetical protein